MIVTDHASRREIAHWVEQYLSGTLSWERLFALVPEEPADEDVAELLDLIEHEPKKGGFLGVQPEVHSQHMARIRELVALLGGDGKSPAPG
jgi:hypothetical protein